MSSRPQPRRPAGVPRAARAREISRSAKGFTLEYVAGRRIVARVVHHPNGEPEWIRRFDTGGLKHGVEQYHFADGRLRKEAHWRHGLQVGLQQQWDQRGRLLCATEFAAGTGRDLWWDGDRLAELREFVNGKRHGVEQYWVTDTRVLSEFYFYEGLEHGPLRQWSGQKLESGYPRFFIRGRRVSRAAYGRAAISDPTLRPYVPAEDHPKRILAIPPRGIARR